VVPVPKKDGSVRLCVDFRRINKVTELITYHIPLVQAIIDKVGKAMYLSKLDLCKGFYQVKLLDQAQCKTAIVTPFGKFQYRRMPFGLINAISTFQRLIDRVLLGLEECCAAYIDDVLIYSESLVEHLSHLEAVLQRLKDAGSTAKESKCELGKSQLEYLGHQSGKGRLAVPEDRVAAIAHYVKPTDKNGIRAFLGITGYYHRFMPDYGKIAQPLTQ